MAPWDAAQYLPVMTDTDAIFEWVKGTAPRRGRPACARR
jgi:hypothetical protein